MTPASDLIAFGKARHGERWIGPLADEMGYCFTAVWRVAVGRQAVTRRMELELERLRREAGRKEREG